MVRRCSPPQRLWAKKIGERAGEKNKKNMRREERLCQMPHPRLALSGDRLFQFSNCTLGIITIKIISLPVLNVRGHNRPSLANIAKLMQNAEPCLGHYQGYDMSKAYCS